MVGPSLAPAFLTTHPARALAGRRHRGQHQLPPGVVGRRRSGRLRGEMRTEAITTPAIAA